MPSCSKERGAKRLCSGGGPDIKRAEGGARELPCVWYGPQERGGMPKKSTMTSITPVSGRTGNVGEDLVREVSVTVQDEKI